MSPLVKIACQAAATGVDAVLAQLERAILENRVQDALKLVQKLRGYIDALKSYLT